MGLFGKVLTPLLLGMIALIFIKSMFTSVGSVKEAAGNYGQAPMFQGF